MVKSMGSLVGLVKEKDKEQLRRLAAKHTVPQVAIVVELMHQFGEVLDMETPKDRAALDSPEVKRLIDRGIIRVMKEV